MCGLELRLGWGRRWACFRLLRVDVASGYSSSPEEEIFQICQIYGSRVHPKTWPAVPLACCGLKLILLLLHLLYFYIFRTWYLYCNRPYGREGVNITVTHKSSSRDLICTNVHVRCGSRARAGVKAKGTPRSRRRSATKVSRNRCAPFSAPPRRSHPSFPLETFYRLLHATIKKTITSTFDSQQHHYRLSETPFEKFIWSLVSP